MDSTMTDLRDFPAQFRARGLHIEARWAEICIESMPRDAGPEQFYVMRAMFFTGAAHVYDLIMKIADERDGKKPTREDLEFLNQLRIELGEFAEKTVLENETAGNA
jgi:hypothetical protein